MTTQPSSASPLDIPVRGEGDWGLEHALKWADNNCAPEAIERLRSRKVAKILADEVRRLQQLIPAPPKLPVCCVCGTTENLRKDGW